MRRSIASLAHISNIFILTDEVLCDFSFVSHQQLALKLLKVQQKIHPGVPGGGGGGGCPVSTFLSFTSEHTASYIGPPQLSLPRAPHKSKSGPGSLASHIIMFLKGLGVAKYDLMYLESTLNKKE